MRLISNQWVRTNAVNLNNFDSFVKEKLKTARIDLLNQVYPLLLSKVLQKSHFVIPFVS